MGRYLEQLRSKGDTVLLVFRSHQTGETRYEESDKQKKSDLQHVCVSRKLVLSVSVGRQSSRPGCFYSRPYILCKENEVIKMSIFLLQLAAKSLVWMFLLEILIFEL